MKQMNPAELEIHESSGNVFADIGLFNSEEYLAKAEICAQLNKLIKARQLKQKEIAELLGIDQPKVSALNRGRLSGFSIDHLLRFLVALDQDIEIRIKPHKKQKSRRTGLSHIQVSYAGALKAR